MAGNLGKEDPRSVQNVQDQSVTGKSSAATSSRNQREKKKAGWVKLEADMEKLKKSKLRLDGQASLLRMDLRESREENINLKIAGKSQSDSILEMGKELIALGEHHQQEIQALKEEHAQEMLKRDRELNALKEEHEQEMLKRDRELNALKEEHAQELLERDRKFNALKEEHEQHMRVCAPWGIDVEYLLENAGEMNNPTATPATAQATSYFVNSDHSIESQMA